MADIVTISAALGSLKTAHELAKVIKSSGNSLEQAEMKFKLADLISALAETKIELADIQTVLIEKDEEIKALKKQLRERDEASYVAPYYWRETEKGKDGPFCQKCKDVDELFVRLQNIKAKGFWHCTNCDTNYLDKDYVSPTRRKRSTSVGDRARWQ
ncbi:hypothetical protein F0231_20900 [Vibrio sp. RE86]|uniref:hypothetical protein n=1 Tax=Vibrio sp. RE86 TaxID=2607605 RepID=UPI0014933D70|nr:hypothetical protein [Vibrio sp. RE86]NOH82167.1 hypothetical protein [Vibrio sp. RE86]